MNNHSTIQLGKKQFKAEVLVSSEDIIRLTEGPRWSLDESTGYVFRRVYLEDGSRKKVYLHRFILGLLPGDGFVVDHINGNRLDNRRENLRVILPGQNSQNRTTSSGASRFRGVHPKGSKWVAQVRTGSFKWSKTYSTEEGAAIAADFIRQRVMNFATPDPEVQKLKAF